MRKTILTIPIDWITHEELVRKLKLFVTSKKPHQLTTVNPEFIVISQENPRFKTVLQESDLSLPDGAGIVLAQTFYDRITIKNKLIRFFRYLLLGFQLFVLPHSFSYKRITGVELTDIIIKLSQEEGWKIFLLGAAPGVAAQAATVWQRQYPGVSIVGVSAANPDDPHIVQEIKSADPDILLVAYGAPKQDLFIATHKQTLKVPIMVGVGGTFDYAINAIRRPPFWVRVIGFEWLARLIQQPKRVKRIYRSTVTYSCFIITNNL